MITINEAIEELSTLPLPNKTEAEHKKHLAARLGVEALKRIQECRHADHTIKEDYLPGEEKE